MADHSTQAKQARETLARALGALQSDPTVPPSLMDVAEPVAMAMGALHGIERTGSLATAPQARDHVRVALGKLQTQAATSHPAVERAMEAVADSLGIIFGLVRAQEAAAGAAVPPAAPAPAVAPAPVAPSPAAPAPFAAFPAPAQPAVVVTPAGEAPSPYAPTAAGAPAYVPPAQPPATFNPAADRFAGGVPTAPAVPVSGGYGAPAQPAPTAQPAAPGFQPASGYQAHDAPAPTAYNPATVAAPPPPPVAPAPQQVAPQLAPKAAPGGGSDPFAAPAKPGGGARPDGGAQRFEAALGISSSTNFYKGLSGNDVIEHGGLFVATYNKVPPVGSPVSLRVILPGGFEFESMATVAWTRENSGNEAPGFGARFTQINAEAKQLVYRYVRNREPLFYDDL